MTGPAGERPRVLLLGGKDSGFRSISELDVDVCLLQVQADLSPLQVERATDLIVLDHLPDSLAERLARELDELRPFSTVVSFYESRLELAARLGERLGVVHNPLPAVLRTRSKLAMRRLLEARGLPSVRYAECWQPGDVQDFLKLVGPPAVLKPSAGSGSRGVVLIDSFSDVEAAWRWCVSGGDLPAIVEEFVDGTEYSVESMSRRGHHDILAITEKITTGRPSFVETGHQLPARLPPGEAEAVRAMVTTLLDTVGHSWGPAHSEVRITPDRGPVIIETQTRFGGDQIWEMVELVTGERFGAATVAGLLGLADTGAVTPKSQAAAIRFFAYENATVQDVRGVEEARGLPGVVRVDIRAKPGQVLGPLTGSWSRQGYVLAIGETVDQAVSRAEAARSTVEFDLSP
jgi:biotin carboxylase